MNTKYFAGAFLLGCALLGLALPANGSAVFHPVIPGQMDQGRYVFEITAAAVELGNVAFHIVITKKDGKFGEHDSTSVGEIDMSHGWTPVPGGLELAVVGKKKGNTMTCDFKVPVGKLGDSHLLFVLECPVEGHPALDLYYAKLKDFAHSS